MAGDTLLRVGNVEDEAALEEVRDALDELGIEYEHVRSEPEDSYPQTAYFYVPDSAAEEVQDRLGRLSEERGYDAEIL